MNKILSLVFLFTLLCPINTFASMSGGNFEIYADTIGVAGTQVSDGGNFVLFGTVGDLFATSTSNGTYNVAGGFLAAQRGDLSFSLSKSSVSLGTLSASSVATDTVTTTVQSGVSTGYTLSVSADGNLRSGANDINNVTDGSVTAGSEEYGMTATGVDSLLSTDVSSVGPVDVASTNSDATNHETVVVFKASIGQATVAGTYSQTVTFTVTSNP